MFSPAEGWIGENNVEALSLGDVADVLLKGVIELAEPNKEALLNLWKRLVDNFQIPLNLLA